MSLRPRIGLFLLYWAVIALLVFMASMVNQQPSLMWLLCGAGLILVGLWLRWSKKAAPELPRPAAAPIMNPRTPRRSLFKLPGRKKKSAPPA